MHRRSNEYLSFAIKLLVPRRLRITLVITGDCFETLDSLFWGAEGLSWGAQRAARCAGACEQEECLNLMHGYTSVTAIRYRTLSEINTVCDSFLIYSILLSYWFCVNYLHKSPYSVITITLITLIVINCRAENKTCTLCACIWATHTHTHMYDPIPLNRLRCIKLVSFSCTLVTPSEVS